MNCKKDDLVRYVGPVPRPNASGWIGRVVERSDDPENNPAWIVSPPLPGGRVFFDGFFRLAHRVLDANLRPIRGGETPEESTEAIRDLYSIPSEVTT